MKKKFSNSWIGSKQVRKQRKYRANSPLHKKRKMLSAHLNKDLRKKYGKRSFPVRTGDEVKILRGEFKRKTGKISNVDVKKQRVAIEGIQRRKKDGTKINVFFHPSSLLIQSLSLDDKKRISALNRKIPEKKNVQSKESKQNKGEIKSK